MAQDEALNQFWASQPDMIRAFLEKQSLFEKLAEEVAYILKKFITLTGVEYSSISHRAKSLKSFCAKVARKYYNSPLEDITDLAGVRIVYLYERDEKNIKTIIDKHFTVIERVDKVADREPHEFGYSAVHYLVKLGKNLKGARYDDLRNLVCEIQVRTILQDSWAIVAHHLSYKKESDVPKNLLWRLNALSGLFVTADDQFNQLYIEREEYKNKIVARIESGDDTLLNQEINLDNLSAYADWKLPNRKSIEPETAAGFVQELANAGYTRINQINDALNRSMDAIIAYETDEPPTDRDTNKKTIYAQVGVIRVALSLIDDAYFAKRYSFGVPSSDGICKYRDRLLNE